MTGERRSERNLDEFDRKQRDPHPDVRRITTRLRGAAPLLAFGAVAGFAFGLWMMFGRFQWFHHDEWDFIAGRKAGDLGDLFGPHGGHWVTVPILLYRILFWSFGLRAYVPYRLPVLTLHLIVAALLVIVMRRAGVRPWIATAAGSLFLLLGAGRQDIVEPFQVCFTGALAFGLAHLLLADHDGPVGRRDWLGLLAGLIGLMFSGVALSMIAIVGIAVLLRRGWRLAMFHTAPLALCYLVWFLAIGHQQSGPNRLSVHGMWSFVTAGLGAVFGAVVQYRQLKAAIPIVLLLGLVVSLVEHRRSRNLARLAAPIALLIGSIVFLSSTAVGRLAVEGVSGARASRYVYLGVAMTLPSLAVAADALANRWRSFLPMAIAVFLVGVPGNIRAGAPAGGQHASDEARQLMLSLPRDPRARQVPRSIRPDPVNARPVTIGWLLDGVESHRILPPGTASKSDLADDTFRLSFDQGTAAPPTTSCRTLSQPMTVTLKKGSVLGLYENTLQITPTNSHHPIASRLVFFRADGTRLAVVLTPGAVRLSAPTSPLNWRMKSEDTDVPPRVCFRR